MRTIPMPGLCDASQDIFTQAAQKAKVSGVIVHWQVKQEDYVPRLYARKTTNIILPIIAPKKHSITLSAIHHISS